MIFSGPKVEQRERSHCSSREDEQEGFLEEEASSYELDHEEETNAGWEKGLSEDGPPLGHGPGKEFICAPVGLIPHTRCVLVAEVWSTHLPV